MMRPISTLMDNARVVNAGGAISRFGGVPVDPRVSAAMAAARIVTVDVMALNDAVSKGLAERVGAEACLITAGAAHGLMVAAAACVIGGRTALVRDPSLLTGLGRRTIAIQMHHVGNYASAYGLGGGVLQTVGNSEACEPDDLIELISGGNVAAVAALVHPGLPLYGLSIRQLVEITHPYAIPVIVDAAASIPPRRNLQRLLDDGCDLISVSGGKTLGGPQASGLLIGREYLIDHARRIISPSYGIGRVAKVTAESIAGLVTAFNLSWDRDEVEWREAQCSVLKGINAHVRDYAISAGFRIEIHSDDYEFEVPALVIKEEAASRGEARLLDLQRLMFGSVPPVYMRYRKQFKYAMLQAVALATGEDLLVSECLSDAFRQIGRQGRTW